MAMTQMRARQSTSSDTYLHYLRTHLRNLWIRCAFFRSRSGRLAGLCLAMPSTTRDPETYAIIGAAMRVHGELGCGFLEAVYHVALRLALEADRVPCRSEVPFRIQFSGQPLRTLYRADLICFDGVLVELKALRASSGLETAQVLNYLKASGLNRALLLNFGAPRLEYRRLVSSPRIPPMAMG
jgi:GxxExxY protein